ncbi:MAG TPA: biotin-independent malonate decarboxylase subunit gamma, partial [Pantoea sp.]|nr:biotin-independent malonate decarboxylase subunit gamma [Pantoea sp.]
NFHTLGLLSDLLTVADPDAPSDADLAMVEIALQKAIADARQDPSLKNRLGAENRRSSSLVRERMRASW